MLAIVRAIVRGRHQLTEFFKALKSRAQPKYVVVCESIHSVGRDSCQFLDLCIDVVVPRALHQIYFGVQR